MYDVASLLYLSTSSFYFVMNEGKEKSGGAGTTKP